MAEPLSSLDTKRHRNTQVELRCIQQAVGITTIYVTHDQEAPLTMKAGAAGAAIDTGVSRAFGGPSLRYVVAIANGHEVMAQMPASTAQPPALADTAPLLVRPEDWMVFDAPGGSFW